VSAHPRLRVAALASGRGSNLQALIDARMQARCRSISSSSPATSRTRRRCVARKKPASRRSRSIRKAMRTALLTMPICFRASPRRNRI
jgi:folate-dependent phosphoribosylglycinamide formyltransferase PurN